MLTVAFVHLLTVRRTARLAPFTVGPQCDFPIPEAESAAALIVYASRPGISACHGFRTAAPPFPPASPQPLSGEKNTE